MKIIILTGLFLFLTSCTIPRDPVSVGEYPPIIPDYINVTIPQSIAPLHFMANDGARVRASFSGKHMRFTSRGSRTVRIPRGKWRKLLSVEDSVKVTVFIREDRKWHRYDSFTLTVSRDQIDPFLCYRKVAPGYESFGSMGIYQRELGGFREYPVVENTIETNSCVNCHAFASGDPELFQFHIRGPGGGTILKTGSQITHIENKIPETISACVYPYWHPWGSHIAYSVNNIMQWFHNVPGKIIDVFDTRSDVVIYHTATGKLHLFDQLCDSTLLETFPSFSADGKTLFFTAAPARPVNSIATLDSIQYALYRIPFDPLSNTMGQAPERICPDSDSAGFSVSLPRPSPDGRFLMFTRSAFGNFTIWHPDADLWLMDLESLRAREATGLNSPDAESYHSWSSSSRWVVFSSRRDDGRYTRLYLSHMDQSGTFSKPFILPQRNPRSDPRLMQFYNIPEFIKAKISFRPRDIHRADHVKATGWKH